VSSRQGAPTVLIVDADVAFVWWLGEMFTEAGYQAIPALNCTQAIAVVNSLHLKIDFLVVSAALSGVVRLVRSLERQGRDLRIIRIGDDTALEAPGFAYEGTLMRPGAWEPVSRPDWLRKLRALLKGRHATAIR
jgi:DNA-binding NtrC family response regulator